MLGVDFYVYDTLPKTWEQFRVCYKLLVEASESRGKIPAITEFGFEAIPQADWWTNVFLKNLHADPIISRMAYACAWRNANHKHHYVPYSAHTSLPDFQEFYRNPATLFESDLWNFYKKPKVKPDTAPSPLKQTLGSSSSLK